MKNEHLDREEGINRLRELIKDIPFSMLTTVDSDGSLRSRPMAMQHAEFDGDLWFFTEGSSPKVDELQHDNRVNLALADPSAHKFISVSGRAEIVRDMAKAKELWNPTYKAWFPKGLDDPGLILVKVKAERAEFWDSPSGKVVQLLGYVKALATGKAREDEAAEDVKVDLRHG